MLRPIVSATLEHVAQVRGAVFVRRRADGDEHHFGAGDRAGDVGGERQPPAPLVALDEVIEPGLVDRQDVLEQPFDLGRVDVGADHLIAGFGETRPDDEADVPGPDDGDVHVSAPSAAGAFERAASDTTRAFDGARLAVTLRVSTMSDALSTTIW